MLQSCGDEDAARAQLHSAVLQPFLERVWRRGEEGEGEGGPGPGAGGGTAASRTLLQMTMAEATCHSVSTSVISHADFQQVMMDKTVDRDVRESTVVILNMSTRLHNFVFVFAFHHRGGGGGGVAYVTVF